ncbi:hypothetical protein PF003_g36834 [Phytophthora fragariae]|nr:hypothetical protein PF003_g36834 [Phytophthora fragariae]
MDETFLASLHIGGNGELSKAALKQRAAALRAMQWTPPMTEFETDTPAYPGFGADEARPVGELLDVWRSPLLTLFFFVPKTVWVSIAKETNRYFLQQVGKRAERMAARQTGRQHETAAQIARRLKASEKYGAHEILRVVGLLVVRMLCPQKRSFAAHWYMVATCVPPEASPNASAPCPRTRAVGRLGHRHRRSEAVPTVLQGLRAPSHREEEVLRDDVLLRALLDRQRQVLALQQDPPRLQGRRQDLLRDLARRLRRRAGHSGQPGKRVVLRRPDKSA